MDLADVSSREAEVLAALGAHLSNAQIAGQLHISIRTVESHVSALLRKLDVSDRHALAAIAVVELPDAAERIALAQPLAAEPGWAAARLARARGRLGDPSALADAVERWERLGARFERECTAALLS